MAEDTARELDWNRHSAIRGSTSEMGILLGLVLPEQAFTWE